MMPREEIIALLRGQVACPVISCLGELGWLARMTAERFDHTCFADEIDSGVFQSVMTYLTALELVEPQAGGLGFCATSLGQTVFKRYGTFCILNSYQEYMQSLRSMLIPDGSRKPQVNRMRNVIGSGAIHERKFFIPALEMVGEIPCRFIADIGSGDGAFLLSCHRRFPRAALLGVDLSAVAVEETLKRLQNGRAQLSISGVVSDGADVATWARHVPRGNEPGRLLISLWFLVHEISRRDPETVVGFFHLLREHCPDATILMGEVVRTPPAVLASSRSTSVMPELTLLHDLSKQGLLAWEEWQYIADKIPYVRAAERTFDVILGPHEKYLPSSFVWYLTPS